MPADPETIIAIQQLGAELSDTIEKKLSAHKKEADEARGRIHDRIETHARESRHQLAEASAEMRGAVQAVSLQVVAISTELRAHTAHDDERFRRIEMAQDATSKKVTEATGDTNRIWRILAWAAGALGIGSAAVSKWGGGGGN